MHKAFWIYQKTMLKHYSISNKKENLLYLLILSIIIINMFVFRLNFIIISIITFCICYLKISKKTSKKIINIKFFLFSAIFLFLCTSIKFEYIYNSYEENIIIRLWNFYITETSFYSGIVNGLNLLSICLWFSFLDKFLKIPNEIRFMSPKLFLVIDCCIRFMKLYICEFKKYMEIQKTLIDIRSCNIIKKLNFILDVLFCTISSSQKHVLEDNFEIHIKNKNKRNNILIISIFIYVSLAFFKPDIIFYLTCITCIIFS